MINQKERLAILENFLWRLNFHRAISMNEQAIFEMLRMSDDWVGAHSTKNGEYSEAQVKKNIDAAYEKLRTLP